MHVLACGLGVNDSLLVAGTIGTLTVTSMTLLRVVLRMD